ncbi:hypothetical protein [Sphingomonas sp. Y38-1Y]|uniref:lipopolysaccharide biosynthesis protein n=1 Tax=Sphingomonas sp. Y38-1Y TaxID=3078265 RepID=UPI0028ECC0DA|nr:hypothetical protein [Sphingomonas sp. Y38-1Y]
MIRRVMAGVGANVFGKLVVAGVQLATVPVLANAWGMHLFGLWVLLSTVPMFLAIGDFGFATAAGTKMAMQRAEGNVGGALRTYQSALLTVAGASILLALVAVAAVWAVPARWFGDDPGLPIADVRAVLSILILFGIATMQGSLFFAAQRADGRYAIGSFVNSLVILAENMALIAAVLLGGSMPVAAGVMLAVRLCGLGAQAFVQRVQVPWLPIALRHASGAEVRALLAPSAAVLLLPLAQAVSLQGTALMVGAAAGQATVPLFTAARTLSRVGLQLCWLFNAPLMPEFSAASARGDRRGVAQMVAVTLLLSALLAAPYALGFALFGQALIAVWTQGAIAVPQPLVLAMAGTILLGGFWVPLSNLILARNRQASFTPAYLVLSLASMAVAYCLSLTLGAIGGGVAMLLLDAAMLAIVLRLSARLLASREALAAAWPTLIGGVRRRLAG